MVYLFGIIGFITGFAIGLGIINVLLRKKSIDEIKANPKNKWKFGILVWVMGFFGMRIGVILFNTYF